MRAKITSGQVKKFPYTFDDIKAEYPENTSFPASASEELWARHGAVVVTMTSAQYDESTQVATLDGCLYNQQQQRWETAWVVRSKTPQEMEAYLQALQNSIVDATQQRLDTFAQTRNYDGVLSLCTYVTSANSKFKQEGQYGVEARDTTWAKLYEILTEVQAGTRPVPAGYDDIEAELPPLVWPV